MKIQEQIQIWSNNVSFQNWVITIKIWENFLVNNIPNYIIFAGSQYKKFVTFLVA